MFEVRGSILRGINGNVSFTVIYFFISTFTIFFITPRNYFLGRNSPPVGQGLLIHEVSRSYTTTHRNRWDFCGREISSSQRPLPDNTHNRQTSMPPVEFETTISVGERPQTYALDRAAIETGNIIITQYY